MTLPSWMHRRLLIALLPLAALLLKAMDIPVTTEMLTDTGDKVMAALMSVLAIWSLVAPKLPKLPAPPPAPTPPTP